MGPYQLLSLVQQFGQRWTQLPRSGERTFARSIALQAVSAATAAGGREATSSNLLSFVLAQYHL